jgi:hypothetical protein
MNRPANSEKPNGMSMSGSVGSAALRAGSSGAGPWIDCDCLEKAAGKTRGRHDTVLPGRPRFTHSTTQHSAVCAHTRANGNAHTLNHAEHTGVLLFEQVSRHPALSALSAGVHAAIIDEQPTCFNPRKLDFATWRLEIALPGPSLAHQRPAGGTASLARVPGGWWNRRATQLPRDPPPLPH